jgi:hypothetical protein
MFISTSLCTVPLSGDELGALLNAYALSLCGLYGLSFLGESIRLNLF